MSLVNPFKTFWKRFRKTAFSWQSKRASQTAKFIVFQFQEKIALITNAPSLENIGNVARKSRRSYRFQIK